MAGQRDAPAAHFTLSALVAGLLARWNVVTATGAGVFAYSLVVVPDPGDLLSHGYFTRLIEVGLLSLTLGFVISRGYAWQQAR